MWFNIIKRRRPHKRNIINVLVPAYIDSILIGEEFTIQKLLDWAEKELEHGRDYRTVLFNENLGFPSVLEIGAYLKERPLKDIVEDTGRDDRPKTFKRRM